MNLSLLAADTPMFGANNRGIILFGFEIYYYAICIVCGMIGAAALSALLMKRRNMSSDFIFLLFVVCIPSAIVCARLFSCLTDPSIGIQNFFRFRDGGLSVTGGVLGGVLAGFIVCRLRKVSFLRAADCVVVNILIAQSPTPRCNGSRLPFPSARTQAPWAGSADFPILPQRGTTRFSSTRALPTSSAGRFCSRSRGR